MIYCLRYIKIRNQVALSECSTGKITDYNMWKKSLSEPVSFTEPQIFINHCLLTKIDVEMGKHTNGKRREREREAGRIVTVCGELRIVVTHCDVVILYFTGSISHGTNNSLSTRPFWNTHTHTLTHLWAYCACVTNRVQPQASTPLVTNYSATLIHSYTPLQMEILRSWIIVAVIPVMA